jgi:hypothetical protein
MSIGLWVLTAAIAAGVAGWKLGRVSAWHQASLALVRKDQMIDGLKAAQDHRRCRLAYDRMAQVLNAHIDHLERRLDGCDDLDGELRRLLDGGGSA